MNNLENLIYELKLLLDLSLKISFHTRGKVCDRMQKEASGFFMKQTLHAYTMYQIINPQYFPELFSIQKNEVFHDFSTAAILSRTMFETYVNMVYLLKLPDSEEELDFRLDMWDLHALCERRKIGISIGSQHPDLKLNEQRITEYINKIKSSQYYSNLETTKKQSIDSKLRDNACIYVYWSKEKTIEKAELVGIGKNHSEYLYKITSSYVHSESFSVMQLLGIQNPVDSLMLCATPLRYVNMFLSLTIKIFSDIVDITKIVNETLSIIEMYDWLSQQDLSELNSSEIK